jgi:hypothetical protein
MVQASSGWLRGMWCWPGSQPRARGLLTITALCLASLSLLSFLGPLEQLEFAGGRHLVAGASGVPRRVRVRRLLVAGASGVPRRVRVRRLK